MLSDPNKQGLVQQILKDGTMKCAAENEDARTRMIAVIEEVAKQNLI